MQTLQFIISRGGLARFTSRALATLTVSLVVTTASAATLDRIKETGHIKLGYAADALPFTEKTTTGSVDGYAAGLCLQVVERVKKQLGLPQLVVDWVPITLTNHVNEVKQGNVDLLCVPTSETAAKRKDVAYSKPVFPGGVRAVVRMDTATALRKALDENPNPGPVWRGSPAAKVLNKGTFAVVAGTTTERWLASKKATLQVNAKTVAVADYRTGIQQLLDRKADVFFGDRSLVLGVMNSDAANENLVVIDRWFTREPLSLALARNDDDFRLLVDGALSDSYADAKFGELYSKWCGKYDDTTRTFFQWVSFAP
jgi:ABC-type amino acid transport substrate-binding protein